LKLERVRTRIATDLHDDIGSSLSQIAILSEVARHKADGNGASEPLRRIADTSRDLVDSMSDIVWAINPQKDHLSDLVQRMRRFAGDTFDATDVGYRFRFDESSRDIPLVADQRREIYLIFKECVNNTAKHSGADSVDIAVTIDGDGVRTEISDNGRGFDVAEAMKGEIQGYGGNGLLNMRKRVERLGGEFEIESQKGTGTRVTFSVPTTTLRRKRRVGAKAQPTD
jgi:signal transduction histidine kinase